MFQMELGRKLTVVNKCCGIKFGEAFLFTLDVKCYFRRKPVWCTCIRSVTHGAGFVSPSHLEKWPALKLFLLNFFSFWKHAFISANVLCSCLDGRKDGHVLGGSQNELGVVLNLCCRKKLFWCGGVNAASALQRSWMHLVWGFAWEKCEQKNHVESSDKDQEFWEHDLLGKTESQNK